MRSNSVLENLDELGVPGLEVVFGGAVLGVLRLDVLLGVLDDLGQDLARQVREGDSVFGTIVLDHLLDRRRLEPHGLVDLKGLAVRALQGDLLRRRHAALEKTAFARPRIVGRTYQIPMLRWIKPLFLPCSTTLHTFYLIFFPYYLKIPFCTFSLSLSLSLSLSSPAPHHLLQFLFLAPVSRQIGFINPIRWYFFFLWAC
jgi:hypothetical protein